MHNQAINEIIYGKKSFQENGKIFVNEYDLEIPHGESYKTSLDELKKIKDLEFDKKKFLSHFDYKGSSMWWFIFPNINPVYKKVVNFIISFQKLIDEAKPSVVRIEDDFNMFNLIQQICSKNKIKLKYSKLNLSKFSMKKKIINNSKKSRFHKITEFKTNKRKKLFLKKNSSIPNINDKIIFAIPGFYRREIFNLKTGHSGAGEYIQQSVMDLLKDKKIVCIDVDYTFRGDYKKLEERLEEIIPWFPIELIINSKQGSVKKIFLQNYKKLLENKKFQNLFYFNEISLWQDLEEIFKEMAYAPNLPFYITLIENLKTYFSNNKPKAIFLPYETGPYALAIIISCKKLGIKTIGISHGFITKNLPMYAHYSCESLEYPLGHPIPNVTLVFGEFAKKVLVEDGYPDDQIVVFGNPAFFNMKKIESTLSKKPLKEKYKIQPNQQVILFTSGNLQPKYTSHGSYDYDVQIWEHLLEEFGNKENFFLILKPHPKERDVTIYKKAVKKHSVNNTLITHNALFELLYISSIVVSVFSTTMIDALCFKKPVIEVKFRDQKHPIPFEEYGAVVTARLDSLSSNIISISNESKKIQELALNRDQFLKDQFGLPELNPKIILQQILE